jgi:DNA-binding MarR family transcriptional regulator
VVNKEASAGEPYIYTTGTSGGEKPLQYFVRVPMPGGGFWPIRHFSIEEMGPDEALRLAREYRDDYVRLSPELPSGIAYSASDSRLDTDERKQIKGLFNFQLRLGVARLATLSLLGVFNNHHLTVREAAEAVSREPGNVSRQFNQLKSKGWLVQVGLEKNTSSHARPSQILALSETGRQVLMGFRTLMRVTNPGFIQGKTQYADCYDILARNHRYASPSTLAILLLYSRGLCAPSKVSQALDIGLSEAHGAISRCAKNGYLKVSDKGRITGGGVPGYKRPLYDVSDEGRRLLALAKQL